MYTIRYFLLPMAVVSSLMGQSVCSFPKERIKCIDLRRNPDIIQEDYSVKLPREYPAAVMNASATTATVNRIMTQDNHLLGPATEIRV